MSLFISVISCFISFLESTAKSDSKDILTVVGVLIISARSNENPPRLENPWMNPIDGEQWHANAIDVHKEYNESFNIFNLAFTISEPLKSLLKSPILFLIQRVL